MNRIGWLVALPTTVLLLLLGPMLPGSIYGGGRQQARPMTFNEIVTLLEERDLTNEETMRLKALVDDNKDPSQVNRQNATRMMPQLQEVRLTYTEGATVYFPKHIVGYVKQAMWGGGYLENPCRARLWGDEENKLHCYEVESQCVKVIEVNINTSKATLPVNKETLESNPCPQNKQTLEVTMMVKIAPPTCGVLTSCSDHATSVQLSLSASGWHCICKCRPEYTGSKCDKCNAGFTHLKYPTCIANPYFIPTTEHINSFNDSCPPLLEHTCSFKKYPKNMHQPAVGPSYLSVLGCGFSALPWGCELGAKTTVIQSVCTLVTAEFVGVHLLLLFESLRVFAPGIKFYIGLEHEKLVGRFEVLKNIGVDVEFVVLKKNHALDFWFHEKPAMMKHVLQKEENTLWIDCDAFLVSPLSGMPNVPSATFGCGVHDPRGWGTGYMAQLYGISNTGVVFARRGTQHLDAWIDAMVRFGGLERNQNEYGTMEILYLDQGPLDYSITHTRGGFKLEPQWNVGWWTADKRIEVPGRPNWWKIPHGQGTERFSLSPNKDAILLDGSPVHIIHSHLPAQEKNYGGLDISFNTLIFDMVMNASKDSLLGKFAPRLARYATHVKNPSPDAIRPKKLSMDFLTTFKKDWD
eukprot:TRINITY_DN20830_c0_g1_i1.p1 TRINITY_DN20830_c0_g1~~TRINITY_DN20830_c0_g1_i1.p1  ORF type:complete len:635 (+),score=89.30 TRINITY_DN20830_c0_g1_i1:37-1941(+)